MNTDLENGIMGKMVRGLGERFSYALRATRRSHLYPVLGALLALVIPLGLIAATSFGVGCLPTWTFALHDVARLPITYVYVLVSSFTLLTGLSYLLGRACDRALLLSITDSLTGLVNRRHFGVRLASESSRNQRTGQSICVLCIDLDHLKTINDRLGHNGGDLVLTALAKTLLTTVRDVDIVARLGGDEFAVLLPETTMTEARLTAERVLAAVRSQTISRATFRVSIGVAELAGGDSTDVLVAADAALYRAKASGGDKLAIARGVPEHVAPLVNFTLTEGLELCRNFLHANAC